MDGAQSPVFRELTDAADNALTLLRLAVTNAHASFADENARQGSSRAQYFATGQLETQAGHAISTGRGQAASRPREKQISDDR
jgi:hypothetical protein